MFLHWSFANAISSMFCMYDLINPWITQLVILEFLRGSWTASCFCPTSKSWVVDIHFQCFHCWGDRERVALPGGRRWMNQPTVPGVWFWTYWTLVRYSCDVHRGACVCAHACTCVSGQSSGLKMRCWDSSWHLGRAEADWVDVDCMILRSFLEPEIVL